MQACRVAEISARSIERWRKHPEGDDGRCGPHRRPSNALTPSEETQIVSVMSSSRFAHLSLKQLVPRLADQGLYLASESTFYPDGSLDVRTIAAAIGMDQLMTEPARLTTQLFAAQGLPAYQYRFSYVAESMRKTWMDGAPHASEIPFVFDTVAVKYGKDLTAEDADLARAIHAYWANFVKTGDPNGAGLPTWPRYAPGSDQILDFTATGPVGKPDPWKSRLDLVAAAADGGTTP